MLTLGSLFDGIGGFPLAGLMCGITPVWSSEIEPFPLKVTAARLPDVKQLGSVTEIDGAAVEPVDIITFGSPCQDLSVAGKQLGIHEGERSNLFFEAIRIIKEMREHDAGTGRTGKHIRPRFAVWENVPGAFSSNKGEDFRAVLEAFASIRENDVSIPRPKKWNTGGGSMAGHGWSLAWRVYDAQYWGVPQRRKRIYLVADFGSERAGEILFEREGLRGDSAESGETREGTAEDAERSVGRSDSVKCMNPWDCQSKRQHDIGGAYPTLQAYNGGGGRCDGVVYALQGNGIDRADTAGCNGCGWRVGEMYTLNTIDRPAIAYPETARSLCARHDSSPCVDRGQNVVCVQNTGRGWWNESGIAETLRTPCGGDSTKANLVVYDARGNGEGGVVPTMTGSHNANISDYTAVLVESNE